MAFSLNTGRRTIELRLSPDGRSFTGRWTRTQGEGNSAGEWSGQCSNLGEMEDNTNFTGLNIRFFGMNEGPESCLNACNQDGNCVAFTYIKKGAYDSNPDNAVCYLKSSVGERVSSTCCISGIKVALGGMEFDIDRPGQDFQNFDLSGADPALCESACSQNPNCQAWTYVKPDTTQGPNPRCWLKTGIPDPVSSTCCVSGVKAQGDSTSGSN